MNQHVIQPAAVAASAHSLPAPDQEARNMRSLALQLRRNGHEYRRLSRDEAARGHQAAAELLAARADRYAADALWYWRRAGLVIIQFGEAS